jgi:hypothetical protein
MSLTLITAPDRLAAAKRKRFARRLDTLALHGDLLLCPALIGAFALFVRVLAA